MLFSVFLFATTIYSVCCLNPTQEKVNASADSILSLIENNEDPVIANSFPFIGGFVRLAFHDCVGDGGCDGCVNHTLADNAGLKRYTDALDSIYNSTYASDMSRADFYALASVVALEKATEDATTDSDKFLWRDRFKLGRASCSASPHEDVANELPSALLNIDDVLSYFSHHFNFTTNEVVALMGAHTLGRAREEDGGFEGRWVRRPVRGRRFLRPSSFLDNEYYKTFINRPRWTQHAKTVNGVTRMQWQGATEDTNTESTRGNLNQPNILLNSDFCFLWNYTVIDSIGTIGCNICFNGPQCCEKSSTEAKATIYANDNAAWMIDFTDIFLKMVGRNNAELTLFSDLEAARDSTEYIDEMKDILNDIMETF